jgi:hypothetical protein
MVSLPLPRVPELGRDAALRDCDGPDSISLDRQARAARHVESFLRHAGLLGLAIGRGRTGSSRLTPSRRRAHIRGIDAAHVQADPVGQRRTCSAGMSRRKLGENRAILDRRRDIRFHDWPGQHSRCPVRGRGETTRWRVLRNRSCHDNTPCSHACRFLSTAKRERATAMCAAPHIARTTG